jgi:hypothetical protein
MTLRAPAQSNCNAIRLYMLYVAPMPEILASIRPNPTIKRLCFMLMVVLEWGICSPRTYIHTRISFLSPLPSSRVFLQEIFPHRLLRRHAPRPLRRRLKHAIPPSRTRQIPQNLPTPPAATTTLLLLSRTLPLLLPL